MPSIGARANTRKESCCFLPRVGRSPPAPAKESQLFPGRLSSLAKWRGNYEDFNSQFFSEAKFSKALWNKKKYSIKHPKMCAKVYGIKLN